MISPDFQKGAPNASPQIRNAIPSLSEDPGSAKLPDHSARGYWQPRTWLILAVVGALGVAGTAAWLHYRDSLGAWNQGEPNPETQGVARSSQAVRVDVVHPKTGGMQRNFTQLASIQPFEYSALFAKVSGYLSVLNVDIGDKVKSGQELAIIDVPELHKAVEQAKAKLDEMRAQKKQAEARLISARAAVEASTSLLAQSKSELERTNAASTYRRKVLARITDLAKRRSVEMQLVDEEEDHYQVALADQRAAEAGVMLAQARLDESTAKVELAKADLEDAEANIRVAEADLGKDEVLANYTRITAPYDGVITERGFHRGDFIRSAADSTGIPLLTVARNDTLRVIVQIPENEVPYLNEGDPAAVWVDALGRGRMFHAPVARIAYAEDQRDRTMRAEIDLKNTDNSLVGGMYGHAIIQLAPATENLTIPSSCLVSQEGDSSATVYVILDGKAHRRQIRVGRDNGLELEVLSGLSPKDLVISRGVGNVTEGTEVSYEELQDGTDSPKSKEE
jgi:RND family efflux transporter MFP subunit